MKKITRRGFLKSIGYISFTAILSGLALKFGITRAGGGRSLWQIDPNKCIACGLCQSDCVLTTSAVKCVHGYAICGYCDLCSGYFKTGVIETSTAQEGQLCPTAAIKRSFIEDPYYEYLINEELCVGCGRCVKGCANFGNGSLFLQIKQELCLNCSRCNLAKKCPSQAISRVDYKNPYRLKGV